MTFFVPKEEVLDIQLTQYGKQLLAKGLFKPHFYAFYDDDIIYDSNYGGFSEHRSDTGERVRNDTPRSKVQYVFSGIETNFEKLKQLSVASQEPLSQNMPQTVEKHFTLSTPLGNSALVSANAPSWSVNVLSGEISGTTSFLKGEHATLPIPQITLEEAVYKTSPVVGDSEEVEFGDAGDSGLTETDLNFATTRFKDGSYIEIREKFILISIDEQNTAILGENFDIEVFIKEEDPKTSQEVLTPLFFDKKISMVDDNGVLLDQEDVGGPANIIDSSYVEHFFNVHVDNEISKRTLCKLVPERDKNGIYANDFLDCNSTAGEKPVDVSGLYDSDVTVEDLADDCLE